MLLASSQSHKPSNTTKRKVQYHPIEDPTMHSRAVIVSRLSEVKGRKKWTQRKSEIYYSVSVVRLREALTMQLHRLLQQFLDKPLWYNSSYVYSNPSSEHLVRRPR